MRYQGGKKRLGSQIADVLKKFHRPGMLYLEPFCGMVSVGIHMADIDGKTIVADADRGVVELLQAVRNGWDPPVRITEDIYYVYQEILNHTSPIRTFVGYGCSWGGKWFGGYARNNSTKSGSGRSYARIAHDSLMRMKDDGLDKIDEVVCADYRAWNPNGCLIYCDPPYRNVTNHRLGLDHDEYINLMNEWSKDNIVIISEYEPYDGWVPIWREKHAGNMRYDGERRVEHLLIREPVLTL